MVGTGSSQKICRKLPRQVDSSKVEFLAGLATNGLDQLLGCVSHDETPLYTVINVSEVCLL